MQIPETPEARYDALTDAVYELYEEERLPEALDLLRRPHPDLDPWAAELAHAEACVLGASGDVEGAFATLRLASEAGGWWHQRILTEDDDLAGLQQLPGFAELVALSEERRTSADDVQARSFLDLPERRPRGVVVALHGAGQSAGHARRDWAGALGADYAVLAVESSQRMSPMYRTWPDQEMAEREIAGAVAELPADLRDVPLVAAGFSAGGRAALLWALTGAAAGVVVLAPALGGVELPEATGATFAPAVVLVGTEDDLLAGIRAVGPRLAESGIAIETVEGLGHAFPDDITGRLHGLLAATVRDSPV